MNGWHRWAVLLTVLAGLQANAGEGDGPTTPTTPSPLERLQNRMEQLTKESTEFQKQKRLLEARARLQFLWLLQRTPVVARLRMANPSARLLQTVDQLNTAMRQQWTTEVPALQKTLDLVIRNRPLAEAVAEIAKASDLRIELQAGSAADAAQLTGTRECRIVWLDLRNATVAQALDWLTGMARLDWRASKEGIVIGSQRLLPGESAWVYEVSRLVYPGEATATTTDVAARRNAESLSAFRETVRKALGLTDEDVHWSAPGQLLIWGSQATHAAAGKLFADLTDPKGQIAGELAELHLLASKRFDVNRSDIEKYLDERAQKRIARVFQTFSWRLLSTAAAGKVDLEALTELQAAWADPQAAAFANGTGALLSLRSAFAITETARALPKNEELQLLARTVAPLMEKEVAAAQEDFGKQPLVALNALRVVYAALLGRPPEARERMRLTFTSAEARAQNPLVSAIAAALLVEKPGAAGMLEVLSKQPALDGEDWVVLAALAARRSGNEAWDLWRANAKELLGRPSLPGSVVVLVNQLGRSALPVVR